MLVPVRFGDDLLVILPNALQTVTFCEVTSTSFSGVLGAFFPFDFGLFWLECGFYAVSCSSSFSQAVI